jgi:hypothetical protein
LLLETRPIQISQSPKGTAVMTTDYFYKSAKMFDGGNVKSNTKYTSIVDYSRVKCLPAISYFSFILLQKQVNLAK